jgi:hypothetical protein
MTGIASAPLGAAAPGSTETDAQIARLERQNAYLKLRCAQLEDDATNLGSQVIRLQQTLERLQGRRAETAADRRP